MFASETLEKKRTLRTPNDPGPLGYAAMSIS